MNTEFVNSSRRHRLPHAIAVGRFFKRYLANSGDSVESLSLELGHC
jgi:hypothetical protein